MELRLCYQTQVEQYKMAGKLAAQAQKKRFKPKNKKTRKWKTKATAQNSQANWVSTRARGMRASHKMKAQLQMIATGLLAKTLLELRGP